MALLLGGCVTTADPNPVATSLQEAQAKRDYFVCQNEARGGAFEAQIVKERKLNCDKVIDGEIRMIMAAATSAEVCLNNLESPNKFANAEIKKRGINCDKVIAAHYQEQQILAQQEAAHAQRQAAAAAMANAFKPAPQAYPTYTNCNTFGNSVNCYSY